MNKLEEMINSVLPNCSLKAVPHIESRIKHWSEKYSALAEMLSTLGFGWDADKKMLQTEKKVFDEWVKTHKKAKGLFGVPFIHYDMLPEIYAKDKATGDVSESFIGAIEDMNQEIANQPLNIASDDENDVNSTQSRTRSGRRPMKMENDGSTSSKKPKVKDSKGTGTHKRLKSLAKMDDIDELVASLHSVSNNFGKIFENIDVNLETTANA